jgi:IS5 family transposase
MRKLHNQQLPLAEATTDHPKAREFAQISTILDSNNSIYALALQDLSTSGNNKAGANGMTAEQVVRAAILKQIGQHSYRDLAFHLADSRVYSNFCKIGVGRTFKKSALQKGIKALSEKTWEQINRTVIGYAKEQDIEKGRKIRVDCTVVESNIHDPYDSELLVDVNRVLTRILNEVRSELPGIVFSFSSHLRRVRRRNLEIMNAKTAEDRKMAYKDIVEITDKTISYSEKGLTALSSYTAVSLKEHALLDHFIQQLQHYLSLARQVLCQTQRRVFGGESVPAQEKIVSIFEEHTDIIRKDRRDTYYGHKICLTGGSSNLILDCVVLEGNPGDLLELI